MNDPAPPTLEPSGLTGPPRPAKPMLPLPVGKPPEKKRSGKGWVWLVVLAALALAVWFYGPKARTMLASSGSAGGSPKAGKKGGGTVPVVAAKAKRGNIGVYITGLGSVTPVYTDVVKSRVDGQLMKVHYEEGDMVHAGDLLVEIDPRPYQVHAGAGRGAAGSATRPPWTTPRSIWTATPSCWRRTPFPSSNWPPRRPL